MVLLGGSQSGSDEISIRFDALADLILHILTVAGLCLFAKSVEYSETQKFGHVTFFWNGNRSGKLDDELETYFEVESDRCPFNQRPKMKAAEIAAAAKDALLSGKFDYVRINFANGDMVGHTGVFPAVLEACEAVDQGVKVCSRHLQLVATCTCIMRVHASCMYLYSMLLVAVFTLLGCCLKAWS